MLERLLPKQLAIVSLTALLLVACGGSGNGGNSAAVTRNALPELVTDAVPDGARIDLRASQYFPAASGDTWTYDRLASNGGGTPAAVTRTVTTAGTDSFTVSEVQQGRSDEIESYLRSSEGLVLVDPAGADWPSAARARIGNLLLYPEPFYSAGGTRISVRQGSLGTDMDGDGVDESFRLELTQTLVGFETATPPLGSFETAHFRTRLTLTLSPSSLKQPVVTVSSSEESWWAPGVGMVQAQRVDIDETGAPSSYSLSLAAARIGGTTLPARVADGTVRTLALTHQALVFDALRGRYYASIPANADYNPNRIAIIDAATGQVSYGTTQLNAPAALAMAPDGSALYVGLNDTGSIAKLALPGLSEVYRVQLPTDPNGGSPLLARALAASPNEADVLAVTLRSASGASYIPGVVLVRGGVVQPQQIGFGPLYTMGPIAFDGDGSTVYSYGNNFGDATLFALTVRSDGVGLARQTSQTTGHGVRDVDWTANGIAASRGLYRSSDLAQLTVFAPYGCRAHAAVAARLVCIGTGSGQLTLIDAANRTELGTASYASLSPVAPGQVVPGPVGQVALRMNTVSDTQPADALWLFDSTSFR